MKRLGISLLLCAAIAVASAGPASGHGVRYKLFQSPSGNIGCVITKSAVRCDIREHTWPTPPRPPSCDVDYGGGVEVGRHEGSFVCAGDTALEASADVLAYGDRISKGDVRCASKIKGMRCVNVETKHGFFLSRDVVRLF